MSLLWYEIFPRSNDNAEVRCLESSFDSTRVPLYLRRSSALERVMPRLGNLQVPNMRCRCVPPRHKRGDADSKNLIQPKILILMLYCADSLASFAPSGELAKDSTVSKRMCQIRLPADAPGPGRDPSATKTEASSPSLPQKPRNFLPRYSILSFGPMPQDFLLLNRLECV